MATLTPVPISQLPAVTYAMDGEETSPFVQGGVTSKAAIKTFPYKSTATGAVARTMFAKAGDIVSVKDFGAVGDGTTDDTVAIQNAILHVGGVLFGGTVFFPPGVYKITLAVLVAYNGVTLAGSGAGGDGGTTVAARNGGTTIVYPANTNGISIAADVGCGVRDLALRPTSAASAGNAIAVSGSGGASVNTYTLIENVVIQDAFVAINAASVARCRIVNCDILDSVSTSVIVSNVIDTTYGGCLIEGCLITTVAAANLLLINQSSGIRVMGCRFVGGNIGVSLNQGISAEAGDLFVIGCLFQDYTTAGVSLVQLGGTGTNGFVIDGNTFRNGQASATSSIIVNITVSNGIGAIKGNTFALTNANEFPIRLQSCTMFTVTGNALQGTGNVATGIYLGANTTLNTISGNIFNLFAKNVDNASTNLQTLVVGNFSDKVGSAIIASGNVLTLPDEGSLFNVGGANFTSISQRNQVNRQVTLIFFAGATATGSATLNLVGGTFAFTASDTLTLVCDGLAWYEVARSVI